MFHWKLSYYLGIEPSTSANLPVPLCYSQLGNSSMRIALYRYTSAMCCILHKYCLTSGILVSHRIVKFHNSICFGNQILPFMIFIRYCWFLWDSNRHEDILRSKTAVVWWEKSTIILHLKHFPCSASFSLWFLLFSN